MSRKRGVIDSIVQGATVEVFHSFGVALAPVAEATSMVDLQKRFDLAGVIRFNGPAFAGKLTLGLPLTVLGLVKLTHGEPVKPRDGTRELTNQIMGRIKNRLLRFHVETQVGLPSVWERDKFEQQLGGSPSAVAYSFRTMRGEALVILDAKIDDSAFVYWGSDDIGSEGDLTLF